MARNNKPQHGENKPLGKPSGGIPASKPVGGGPAAGFTQQGSQASGRPARPHFSKKQEVSDNAKPERNTVSESEGTDVGKVNAAPRQEDEPDYSSPQDEFDTAASPSQNTAPQSTSPSAVDPAEVQIPGQPLPDLRGGIPSTWAFEHAEKTKLTASPLDLTEAEDGGHGKGELPASAYISSTERNRNKRFSYMYAFLGLGTIGGTLYLGRNWETEELVKAHPNVPQGMSPLLMWARARARYDDYINYYHEPAFPKLLPTMTPEFERPYTLVLDLEDLLIKGEWTREHGWRIAKRPGVDYFLRYLSQYYELVIWTSQPSTFVDPVIRKLDPYHIVMWPLFREATLYRPKENEYIKDLSYLNRDLSKVIVMDTKPSHVQNQPENAVLLAPWAGNADDKDLIAYIPFLEYIHTMATSDVRKAIASFDGKHIPTEFAKREAIARAKFQKEYMDHRPKKPSGAGFLANALGIKHQSMNQDEISPSEAFAQGKMLQDVARERGQKMYDALEKEIRENGAKWLAEEAAAEEKMKEEGMKAMKSGFLGFLGGGGEEKKEKKG